MKKKKVIKKKIAKKVAKKTTRQIVEIQVSTPSILPVPTTQDLAEPMREGTKLTIPATWITSAQLIRLTEKTPLKQVYKRPGKGGKVWDYVTVSYIQRLLDYVFGWNWDFEIVEHGKEADHVWVLGRLTVRDSQNKHQIVKTQFGRSEVKYKSGTKDYVDYGNDLKAASSDALKKCASMLGIARDIYGKAEYKEETGRNPIETADVIHETPRLPSYTATEEVKTTYQCVGSKGKGCAYGVADIDEETAKYSQRVYGKKLCRDCQKDAKQK